MPVDGVVSILKHAELFGGVIMLELGWDGVILYGHEKSASRDLSKKPECEDGDEGCDGDAEPGELLVGIS